MLGTLRHAQFAPPSGGTPAPMAQTPVPASCDVRTARTNSIIWRRYPGAYGGLDLGMVDTSFPKNQVSTKANHLHHGIG